MFSNIFVRKKKKEKIIIFGTGSAAVKYVKNVKKTHEIICFMDNDPIKHGKKLHGLSIFHPDEIKKFPDINVVVASEFFDEIYANLNANRHFTNTNIIYYRAMNTPKTFITKIKLLLIEQLKALACRTPHILIPLIRSLLKIRGFDLIEISSLDKETDHRVAILRAAKNETVVGPNFVNGIQKEIQLEIPAVALYRFHDCNVSINSRAFGIQDKVIIEKIHTVSDTVAKYNRGHLIHHFQNRLALVQVDNRDFLSQGILINSYYDKNYYHWIIDIFPQLIYINELPAQYNDFPILISYMAEKIDSVKEMLSLFNINRDIIYLPSSKNYRVKDLLIISSPNRYCPRIIGPAWSQVDCSFCRKDSIHYIRNLVSAKNSSQASGTAKRIFLAPSMKHRKYNQDEIFNELQVHGFIKINPERMGLAQQAEIFGNAEMIVGPTGAAWTNLVFAKHGANALCWMAEEWGDASAFSNLADIVGVKLDYLTYHAGVDNHLDLYSMRYEIAPHEVKNWIRKFINNK
jgi:capsular polysaccharide biosynthesis protein